mmetsp:Transcript_109038/g.170488  ORF Transcript_109038/g.170488 Transcript_109038/m.170488 type:complete len:209 (+) Transcript_109038:1727-2353(+)
MRSEISLGWSPVGTFVNPGKSTSVKSITLGEKMLSKIGSSLMPALSPQVFAVSAAISCRTCSKLRTGSSILCANSAHSTAPPGALSGGNWCVERSCSTNGRRVTMPEPRGRKSRPTKLSSTEVLPTDCDPTTTIWGSPRSACRPTPANTSCSVFITARGSSAFTVRFPDTFAAVAASGAFGGAGQSMTATDYLVAIINKPVERQAWKS